jgi:CheY-like chemotaxis protein
LKRLGYSAQVAASGVEVLRILQLNRFDVILMDCQMPELDGYETTRRIREREKEWKTESPESVRIIAMTANALDGDRARCLRAGMDDYLSKPFRAEELQAALERSSQELAASKD